MFRFTVTGSYKQQRREEASQQELREQCPMTILNKGKPKASHGDFRLNSKPAFSKLIGIPERRIAYLAGEGGFYPFGEIFLLTT